MEAAVAKNHIRETFENPFDKTLFAAFTRNLLKSYESRTFSYQGIQIQVAYQEFIQSYERIGKYFDSEGKEIDILVVNLKKGHSLDRARSMQRNFVARYLNGGRDPSQLRDAALVAFVAPDISDWRFSLVKMDYQLEETLTGKVKVKTDLTPARRWSFRVGEFESSHTAQSRFMDILKDDEHPPELSDLEKAFNVEVVTREFFEKYRGLFVDVKEAVDHVIVTDQAVRDDFSAKNINTSDFAKKLLGQIVFLYFLQKKGWFGVARDQDWGSGPRNFLRRLFEKKHAVYNNFFNDILEPLFYEALAKERDGDFYSRFNCKIPFLNGGLFDPLNGYSWWEIDILLPDTLFSNSFKTKEGDTGSGILDIFDRYNFTVKEDEPLEKEVAVDPEMLGKVFENLLEVKDRKSKGTYYTPREIVHYMCQESLINYLDTAVNAGEVTLGKVQPVNLKLFGAPATQQMALKASGHTGRIPRQDIEEFIRKGELTVEHDTRGQAILDQGKKSEVYIPRLSASIRENAALFDSKLSGVRVCDPAVGSGAFLVGMMNELVRARSTLNINLVQSGRSRYDFKRHAIQECLYGVDIDPGAVEIAKLRLWLSLVVDEEDYQEIKPLPNLDYKVSCGNSLLKCEQSVLYWPLFDQLEALKRQFFDETSRSRKLDLKNQIESLFEKIEGPDKLFNFTVNFSEVFPKNETERRGFDIIIANPPYVRHEKITDQKAELKKYFECFEGTADIYVYFYERGRQVLKKNGVLTFISSNKYFRAGYGEKLRRYLANNCQICRIIDFGDAPVFDAIAYPSIIILRNAAPQGNHVNIFTWKPGPELEYFAGIVHSSSSSLSQTELIPDGWRLEDPMVLRLLDKLHKAGKPLGEYVNGRFYRGVLTGLNEAFVVDRAMRDRLIAEHQSSVELLKPFLRGRDVKRWHIEFAGQYLIKIESSENKKHPWSGKTAKEAEVIFSKTYPAIYSWLNNQRKSLIKRDDQGKYFWELRSCKYWDQFETYKIAYPNICKRNEFAWEDQGYFVNQKAFIIPEASKYLLGVLNSSVVTWLFDKLLAKLQNGFYEPSSIFLKDFPIPVTKETEPVENLVNQILAVTKVQDYPDDLEKQVKINELERQIDMIVYQLYDLTPEEVALVEGKRA